MASVIGSFKAVPKHAHLIDFLSNNVFVKNLESEGIAIEETSGDELTIFTDKGLFEFKSQNKNRVTTKIKF